MARIADQVGIYAPYTWDEATEMAGAVGGLAKMLGLHVSWCPSSEKCQDVHFRWDKEVLGPRKGKKFQEWTKKCSHIVWFEVHKERLKTARSSSDAQNILVPLYHRLDKRSLQLLDNFDVVVCPSEATTAIIRPYVQTYKPALHLWDSTLRLQRKKLPADDEELRLLMIADGQGISDQGNLLLSVLRLLLDHFPTLRITLRYSRRWSKAGEGSLKELVKRSDGRLEFLKQPNFIERTRSYGHHDLAFCCCAAANSGHAALECLSAGLPVISFDVPPFNEFIQAGYNGHLIECRVETDMLGIPRIKPKASSTFDILRECLGDPDKLDRWQRNPWSWLETRSRCFLLYWKRLWSLYS